jgi:hypothetical protein
MLAERRATPRCLRQTDAQGIGFTPYLGCSTKDIKIAQDLHKRVLDLESKGIAPRPIPVEPISKLTPRSSTIFDRTRRIIQQVIGQIFPPPSSPN